MDDFFLISWSKPTNGRFPSITSRIGFSLGLSSILIWRTCFENPHNRLIVVQLDSSAIHRLCMFTMLLPRNKHVSFRHNITSSSQHMSTHRKKENYPIKKPDSPRVQLVLVGRGKVFFAQVWDSNTYFPMFAISQSL